MWGSNQQKRPASQHAGGPPKSQRISSNRHPASKHNSGSSFRIISPEHIVIYNNFVEQFDQCCSEYKKAHADFIEEVRRKKENYAAKKYRVTKGKEQELQELADNAKTEKAWQEKEAKFKEMTHAKLEAIEEEFNKAMQRADNLATPKEQDDAKKKAKKSRKDHKYRARQDARLKLSEPADVDAIARTPEGEEINRKFDQMFQKAKEDVDNGLVQIESVFVEKIKDIIAKQRILSGSMDAENFRNAELDVEEACDMVRKTQSARQIIERLHEYEKPV